jgi:hypothetical protein
MTDTTATAKNGHGLTIPFRRIADVVLTAAIAGGAFWAKWVHESLSRGGERLTRVEEKCERIKVIDEKVDRLLQSSPK